MFDSLIKQSHLCSPNESSKKSFASLSSFDSLGDVKASSKKMVSGIKRIFSLKKSKLGAEGSNDSLTQSLPRSSIQSLKRDPKNVHHLA